MTLIRPEGFASVVHQIRLLNDPEPMAVTYGVETAGFAGTVQALADNLHDAFWDIWQSTFPLNYSFPQTEVRWQVSAPPDDPQIGLATTLRQGGNSVAAVPQNTAHLMHKRSSLAGRRGRGRLYLPGVAEAGVDERGLLTSGTIAALNTNGAALLARLTTDATSMVLLHQSDTVFDAGPADVGLYPTPVTALLCDPVVATQRRRLRK